MIYCELRFTEASTKDTSRSQVPAFSFLSEKKKSKGGLHSKSGKEIPVLGAKNFISRPAFPLPTQKISQHLSAQFRNHFLSLSSLHIRPHFLSAAVSEVGALYYLFHLSRIPKFLKEKGQLHVFLQCFYLL